MNIQFYNTHTGDASLIETEGHNISLTYEHLWDKTGKQPVLLAWFSDAVNRWIREDTDHSYTDITIS